MQIESPLLKKHNSSLIMNQQMGISKRQRSSLFGDTLLFKRSSLKSALIQYTTAVYSAAPTRCKYDGKMGFNLYKKCVDEARIYEKLEVREKMEDMGLVEDKVQELIAEIRELCPQMVIDELLHLFTFITSKLRTHLQISAQLCLEYIKQTKFQYINFTNPQILQLLQAKTPLLQSILQKMISKQLMLFLQSVTILLQQALYPEQSQQLDFDEEEFESLNQQNMRKRVKKD